jgi:hypothetical protein
MDCHFMIFHLEEMAEVLSDLDRAGVQPRAPH